MTTAHRYTLASRPTGMPLDENFDYETIEIPPISDGQVLVKAQWLSLDPYMRGRMSAAKSYAPPIEIGAVIVGEFAGVIVESKHPNFKVGEHICCQGGWQDHAVVDGNEPSLQKVDASVLPLSAYLGVAGMPGRTAYFGLLEKGRPQAGETVVVSAASGAVGSVVGQIAKMKGCRVVGVAGGKEKCHYVINELGFDACVDYKAGNLDADLATACPDGIDVYFENVGGDTARAVAKLLNSGARIPVCGYISNYNDSRENRTETPFHIFGALNPVPEHGFFLVHESEKTPAEMTGELASWINEGKLKYRESVVDGLQNAPEAFRGLLTGKNFGKQLIKIID
ncbi:MAG: NADP-dependent oxidoreductase [Oceanicoccus sp.]